MPVFAPDPTTGAIREMSGMLSWVAAAPAPPPSGSIPARNNLPIMPLMGSASQDGYSVSIETGSTSQAEYDEGGVFARAWKMFNRVVNNLWYDGFSSKIQVVAGNPATYIRAIIQLPTATPVYALELTVRGDAPQNAFSAFTWCGWNSATNAWVDLSSYAGVSFTSDVTTTPNGQKTKTLQTTAQGLYSRYSYYFTASGALGQIAEAQIYS